MLSARLSVSRALQRAKKRTTQIKRKSITGGAVKKAGVPEQML
jgi:hypothetical protein